MPVCTCVCVCVCVNTGRYTVPVLWDKKEKTIVNNESAEILRMFNSAFNGLGEATHTYTHTLTH